MRRPPSRARRLLGAALALAIGGPVAPAALAAAPEDAPSSGASAFAPDAVKAAYLVNFLRFTDWPAGVPAPDAPYVVGISGNRALEDELIRLADRQLIRGHRLRVVRLRTLRDVDGLHLAFFEASPEAGTEALSPAEALPALRRRPVLSVSDSPAFAALGGIVSLYREDAVLRFAIASDAARESGLGFSSRLLALARIHREDTTPPPAP